MCCFFSKADHSRFCYDPNLRERLFENPQSLAEASHKCARTPYEE